MEDRGDALRTEETWRTEETLRRRTEDRGDMEDRRSLNEVGKTDESFGIKRTDGGSLMPIKYVKIKESFKGAGSSNKTCY